MPSGDCVYLKIGTHPPYTEGDVIVAANEDRANDIWAQRIFGDVDAPVPAHGRRPLTARSRQLQKVCCQFEHERIGKHRVKIIERDGGEERIVTGPEYEITIGNDRPQQVSYTVVYHETEIKRRHPHAAVAAILHVADKKGRVVFDVTSNKLTIDGIETPWQLRKRNEKHMRVVDRVAGLLASGVPVYGAEGNEIWYSQYRRPGREAYEQLAQGLDGKSFTQLMEEQEPEFSESQKWPAQVRDLKEHLVLCTTVFDDATAAQMAGPLRDGDGNVVHSRRYWIDWRTIVPVQYHADIENMETSVDLRPVQGTEFPVIDLAVDLKEKTVP